MMLGTFGGGAILLGVLIAIGAAMRWPVSMQYIWAAVAIIWGTLSLIL